MLESRDNDKRRDTMTTTERQTNLPGWGLTAAIPADAPAAFGARLIVTQDGTTDLLFDRMDIGGEDRADRQRLADLLNAGRLRAMRDVVEDLLASFIMDTRKGEPFVIFEDDGVLAVANTNGSAGYCYVSAWLKP
jgi:hypothetical protein